MADLLDRMVPRRLCRVGGEWILEVERLAQLSGSLYRPRTERVHGAKPIVEALEQMGCSDLLAEAHRVMSKAEGQGDMLLVAEGRTWIADGDGPDDPRDRIADLERELEEARAEIDALRQLLDESAVGDGPEGEGEPGPAPEPDAEPGPEIEGEPEPDAEPDAEPAPQDGPEPEVRLRLPDVAAVAEVLAKMLGDEVLGRTVDDRPPLAPDDAHLWISPLIDEAGACTGALVLDAKAVVHLGGSLLMMEAEERDAVLENGEVPEDLLDAASEICNTLRASFNGVGGNPHVTAGRLQASSSAGWMARPAARIDYVDGFGGRLILLAR